VLWCCEHTMLPSHPRIITSKNHQAHLTCALDWRLVNVLRTTE
jgi:hypothetical protein